MCGIVAVVSVDGTALDNRLDKLEERLDGALDKIEHRGPDGKGIWVDDKRRVALAHCRLAINDLSVDGHQPLHSSDRTIHAVVNGELYDYDNLRLSLEAQGHTFKSHSDSELVLALYKQYGLSFLSHMRGEYAVVLFDETTRTFIAARDRYGIKPLFVRQTSEGVVMFAAEMKAFLPLDWKPEWDVGALIDGGWGQDTRSVFKGVQKIRPGHYMLIRDGMVEIRQYWDAEYPDKRVKEVRSEEEMIQRTQELLVDSVRQRLRADVPVGIYLSGGIDSSAIAGIASHLVNSGTATMGCDDPSQRVCCFSIAFDESSGFDESQISERTANHLGVRFLKAHMSEKELAADFEEAVYHVEHHNQDLNFVGKFALSKVPRQHGYKVVLTGEGADEHFGGYPLYLPDFLAEQDQAAGKMDEGERERLFLEKLAEARKTYEIIGADPTYFDKRSDKHLPITTPSALLAFTPPLPIFNSASQAMYGPVDPLTTIANNIDVRARAKIESSWHPLHSAMYVWGKGHLSNQFLSCLGDRVEMAHSVEARTPFLDHPLTEYINSLPPSIKIRHSAEKGFVEKYALREAVKPFVTDEVYKRTKHAYAAPTTYPLDGPMQVLLERLISQGRVEKLGFISWEEVERLKKRAFVASGQDVWAWRVVLLVAEWTVLSERFEVRTWAA